MNHRINLKTMHRSCGIILFTFFIFIFSTESYPVDSISDSLIVEKLLAMNEVAFFSFNNVAQIKNGRVVEMRIERMPELCGTGHSKIERRDNHPLQPIFNRFPDEFALLDSLHFLSMVNTALTSIPPQIFKLKNLREFHFIANPLKRIPEDIFAMESLTHLTLAMDSIDSFPAQLFQMKNLRYLNLSNNQIAVLPEYKCGDKSFDLLDLSRNRIENFPESYCRCSNIKKRDYHQNAPWITTEGCNKFSKSYDPWIIIGIIIIPVMVIVLFSTFANR